MTVGLILGLCPAAARAQTPLSTAFTYQGELLDGGNPANGTYNLKVIVFDAALNGNALTPAIAKTVQAANGRFTITLDPGAGIFTGAPRWMELYMRTNLTGLYTMLSPRQAISTTPYATFAAGANAAGLSGTISAANIASGTITSDLLATNSITASELAAGAVTANKLGADVGVWSVVGGNIYRASGAVGIGVANPNAALHINGGMKLNGVNTIEFGAGVVGKELSAGKVGYEVFTADALDIVGAGTTPTNRKIKVWAEGGATFNGEVKATVFTVTGGSDVAEPYHVAGANDVEPIPGMVVSIDPDKIGQMRVASRAYDRTVAGILSGANGIAPGTPPRCSMSRTYRSPSM